MNVSIDCVDGETRLECTGKPKTLLAFLEKHDHEGSSLCLERNGDHCYNSEVIYSALKEEIGSTPTVADEVRLELSIKSNGRPKVNKLTTFTYTIGKSTDQEKKAHTSQWIENEFLPKLLTEITTELKAKELI